MNRTGSKDRVPLGRIIRPISVTSHGRHAPAYREVARRSIEGRAYLLRVLLTGSAFGDYATADFAVRVLPGETE